MGTLTLSSVSPLCLYVLSLGGVHVTLLARLPPRQPLDCWQGETMSDCLTDNGMQVYTGEIFPTRIREAGVAIGTAVQWLFNFVFSQATPHAVTNLGWKTFVMFAVFNYALVVFVWFFIKETKGKSLEEMEACEYSYQHMP